MSCRSVMLPMIVVSMVVFAMVGFAMLLAALWAGLRGCAGISVKWRLCLLSVRSDAYRLCRLAESARRASSGS